MSLSRLARCVLAAAAVVSASTSRGSEPAAWETVVAPDGSAPVARHEAAFVAFEGRGYLLAGRGRRPVSIYDPTTETWSLGAKPPLTIHHVQPALLGGRIVLAGAFTGGYPGEAPIDQILFYDPAADRWEWGDPIPAHRTRGAAGAVAVGDALYLVCGARDGHRGGHVAWFDHYDAATGAWTELPDAPRPRDHFQAAVIGDDLYLVGGRLSSAPKAVFRLTVPEVDVFNFSTGVWRTLEDPLPTPRAGLFVAVCDGKLVAIGGESGTRRDAHDEVEVYDPATGRWSRGPSLEKGRHGTGAVLFGDRLVTASGSGARGGRPELTSVESLTLR